MKPDEATWTAAVAEIAGAERIGLVGHVRPDGDALGSILALGLAARNAGKDVVASFGEPFVLGDEFDFLDRSILVPPGSFPHDLELAIVCDTGVLDRVGSVAPAIRHADRVLVVDHHLTPGTLGDVRLVDSDAAATAQLVHELLRRLGWETTKPVAEALYVGLVTDTGRFQYSSTTPEVHRIAAELIASGVEPDRVGRRLYEEVPFGYLAVVARVLGRARLEDGARLVWSTVGADDLSAGGIGWESADTLIDLLRVAKEATVACLLKDLRPGVVKGSLRSRGEVDVAAVAGVFGGGGHHNAAGFTTDRPVEQVIERILGLLS